MIISGVSAHKVWAGSKLTYQAVPNMITDLGSAEALDQWDACMAGYLNNIKPMSREKSGAQL